MWAVYIYRPSENSVSGFVQKLADGHPDDPFRTRASAHAWAKKHIAKGRTFEVRKVSVG